jgi:serine/threonine protein kinase
MGTPSYMAPEQASGAKDVGPAADVWALGAILYEMLTGRPPFRAATVMEPLLQVAADPPVPPSRLRAGIPPDLEAVCLRCLEKDSRRRPGSAAALAEELERFLATGGQPSERPPGSRPAPGLRPRALAFSPEGQALAVGFADGSVRLYDLVTDEVRVLATTHYPRGTSAAVRSRVRPGRADAGPGRRPGRRGLVRRCPGAAGRPFQRWRPG